MTLRNQSLPFILSLAVFIHPILYFLWFITLIYILKDDRSCDSDDGIGPGSRGRSGSHISQTSRVESEESAEDQYDAKRRKGSNGSEAHEEVIVM